MATIIIQGNSEENKKVVSVLRDAFSVVNKKAGITTAQGATVIADVFMEGVAKELSEDEILKALYCCTHVERKCNDCPLLGVKNCKEKALTDGSVVVSRIMSRAGKVKEN